MKLSEEQIGRIRSELDAGNKIQAIVLYREYSGLGLKEARGAIDQFEVRGEMPSAGSLPDSGTELNDEQVQTVRRILWDGSKIKAIHQYRAFTGAGLKDSKEAVERIEARYRAESPEYGASRKRGCLGMAGISEHLKACPVF